MTTSGITLPCPRCGEAQATIHLDLTGGFFMCQDCNEDFSCDDLEEIIRKWRPVIAWAKCMPTQQQVDEE